MKFFNWKNKNPCVVEFGDGNFAVRQWSGRWEFLQLVGDNYHWWGVNYEQHYKTSKEDAMAALNKWINKGDIGQEVTP